MERYYYLYALTISEKDKCIVHPVVKPTMTRDDGRVYQHAIMSSDVFEDDNSANVYEGRVDKFVDSIADDIRYLGLEEVIIGVDVSLTIPKCCIAPDSISSNIELFNVVRPGEHAYMPLNHFQYYFFRKYADQLYKYPDQLKGFWKKRNHLYTYMDDEFSKKSIRISDARKWPLHSDINKFFESCVCHSTPEYSMTLSRERLGDEAIAKIIEHASRRYTLSGEDRLFELIAEDAQKEVRRREREKEEERKRAEEVKRKEEEKLEKQRKREELNQRKRQAGIAAGTKDVYVPFSYDNTMTRKEFNEKKREYKLSAEVARKTFGHRVDSSCQILASNEEMREIKSAIDRFDVSRLNCAYADLDEEALWYSTEDYRWRY